MNMESLVMVEKHRGEATSKRVYSSKGERAERERYKKKEIGEREERKLVITTDEEKDKIKEG